MGETVDEQGQPLPEDPGWRPALRGTLGFLIPFQRVRRIRRARRQGRVVNVVALRSAFLSFVSSALLFLIVLVPLFPSDDPPGVRPDLVGAGVLGLGVLGLAGSASFGRRPLKCGTPDELGSSYASLFFIRMALAEATVLYGFVGSFLVGRLWPYLVGLALATIGFALCAPTALDLRRRDHALASEGCPHSLRRALYSAR